MQFKDNGNRKWSVHRKYGLESTADYHKQMSRYAYIFDTAFFLVVMTQVGGQKMLKYADDLLVIIEGMLEDSSSAHKQEVVVRTLGQVVASTGLVVEPYNRFPNLLMILLNMLFTEPEQSVRKEVKHTY